MVDYLTNSIEQRRAFADSPLTSLVKEILSDPSDNDNYLTEGTSRKLFRLPGLKIKSKTGEEKTAVLKVWKSEVDFPAVAFEPRFFGIANYRERPFEVPSACFIVNGYGRFGLVQEDLSDNERYDVKSLSYGVSELDVSGFLPVGYDDFEHWETQHYLQIAQTIGNMNSKNAINILTQARNAGRELFGASSFAVSEGSKLKRVVTTDIDQLYHCVVGVHLREDLSPFKELVYKF